MPGAKVPIPCPCGTQDFYYTTVLQRLYVEPVWPDLYDPAWCQGMASRAIGKWQRDNPYKPDETPGWRGWDDGWVACERAHRVANNLPDEDLPPPHGDQGLT